MIQFLASFWIIDLQHYTRAAFIEIINELLHHITWFAPQAWEVINLQMGPHNTWYFFMSTITTILGTVLKGEKKLIMNLAVFSIVPTAKFSSKLSPKGRPEHYLTRWPYVCRRFDHSIYKCTNWNFNSFLR